MLIQDLTVKTDINTNANTPIRFPFVRSALALREQEREKETTSIAAAI